MIDSEVYKSLTMMVKNELCIRNILENKFLDKEGYVHKKEYQFRRFGLELSKISNNDLIEMYKMNPIVKDNKPFI
jgi:hypothetical protein